MPAPKVKYILSASEIPAGQNYVLVRYGEKYEETKTSVGPYDYGRPTKIESRKRALLFDGCSHCQTDWQASEAFRDFCLQIVPTAGV